MGLGGDIERFYAGLEPVGERYVRCCCHVRDRQASSERGSTDVTTARRSGRVPRVTRSESRSNKRKDEQNMYMYTYRDQDGRMGGRDESSGLSCWTSPRTVMSDVSVITAISERDMLRR